METPVLDFINSPWVYVAGLSLPVGLAVAFCLIVSTCSKKGGNTESSSNDNG